MMPLLTLTYTEDDTDYPVTIIPASVPWSALKDGQLDLDSAAAMIDSVVDSIAPPGDRGERIYTRVARGRRLPAWSLLSPAIRECFAMSEESLEVLEIAEIIRQRTAAATIPPKARG